MRHGCKAEGAVSVFTRLTREEVLGALPLKAVRRRKGYHWFVVGTVCIGAFMAALDASIINIALPVLKKQFDVGMHIIEWVSLVYLLTLGGLIVPFGRLADLFGRRWMYALGFTVFIVGSAMCGWAPSLLFLLVARVVQAVGAAMLQANSVAIITAAAPASDRGKAIGFQASAQGIGLSLGPAVGGALLALWNWRWIFFVNLPIGVIGTVLGILLLPEDEKRAGREPFDYAGAALLAPTLVALIYFLNMGVKEGWASSFVVSSYVVFIVGLAAFWFVEKRSEAPMVDLSLFKNRTFVLGNVTGVLSFAVMYAVLLLYPFYLDDVRHMNPFHSGLFLSVVPIGMTLLTPASGAVADRVGSRLPVMFGMAMACIGCVVLALVPATAGLTPILIGLFLVGAGLGAFTPPNNSRVMGSAPAHHLGVAGGILNMSRTLGMGLGIALGGLCYQLFLAVQGVVQESAAPLGAMIHAFHWSFLVVAGIAAVTWILSSLKVLHPVQK
ncbi:MFS transporter [Kyrpidia tusciae]|uniref:Drug resistance transporter, EmrB/QacA subfamily n=1 Tax=Kyrpidia tusciae (strain DSM 2912 / NBRC 15312 / T2) TaxID=562970 RepID=D5WT62_KYRT2|nr:MFS transporter [Kyrpidia tusciae]ADG05166.1 drug resistance transporter, EmrB/QacA subfamily [Kyrpidia tusciae DSM 2912]